MVLREEPHAIPRGANPEEEVYPSRRGRRRHYLLEAEMGWCLFCSIDTICRAVGEEMDKGCLSDDRFSVRSGEGRRPTRFLVVFLVFFFSERKRKDDDGGGGDGKEKAVGTIFLTRRRRWSSSNRRREHTEEGSTMGGGGSMERVGHDVPLTRSGLLFHGTYRKESVENSSPSWSSFAPSSSVSRMPMPAAPHRGKGKGRRAPPSPSSSPNRCPTLWMEGVLGK